MIISFKFIFYLIDVYFIVHKISIFLIRYSISWLNDGLSFLQSNNTLIQHWHKKSFSESFVTSKLHKKHNFITYNKYNTTNCEQQFSAIKNLIVMYLLI